MNTQDDGSWKRVVPLNSTVDGRNPAPIDKYFINSMATFWSIHSSNFKAAYLPSLWKNGRKSSDYLHFSKKNRAKTLLGRGSGNL